MRYLSDVSCLSGAVFRKKHCFRMFVFVGILMAVVSASPSPAAPFGEIKILPDESVAGDEFGAAVAIYGDYVLIGAPGKDSKKGMAYIFQRSDQQWRLQAKLNASDGAYGDRFGVSVALSPDYAVVGAINHKHADIVKSGSAYIFKMPAEGWNGTITESAELINSDGAFDDRLGMSAGIYQDHVIIGAPYKTVSDNKFAGSAYMFTKPAGGWSGVLYETARLKPSVIAANQFFGFSVSIAKDYAVVGARGLATTTSFGASYIFKKPDSGWATMTETEKLSSGIAGDMYGDACVISEDFAVVGAYSDDRAGKNRGTAYLYKRSGDYWIKEKELTAGDAADGDEFSRTAVAMADDMIVIGAKNVNKDNVITGVGAFYMFRQADGDWTESEKIMPGDGVTNDKFGTSVAVWGNYAVSGAPDFDLEGKSSSGAAYIYQLVFTLQDVLSGLQILSGIDVSGVDVDKNSNVEMQDVIFILQKMAELRR